jgi:tetratricopeptide (TPR) repeat protein
MMHVMRRSPRVLRQMARQGSPRPTLACAALGILFACLVPGCERAGDADATSTAASAEAQAAGAPPPPTLGAPSTQAPGARPDGLPTATSASIAELNLDFSIAQGRNFLTRQPAAGEAARSLVAVLLLRARTRNTFDTDFDEALRVARAITKADPQSPDGWLALASVQVALHEFGAARASVDKAAVAGASADDVQAQRNAIAIAVGETKAAMASIADAARTRPGYGTHNAHAIALQEFGKVAEADAAYAAALAAYNDVSPYAIAWVFFQRGVLWTDVDDAKARRMYESALAYLPDHITTNVHLAELEHAAGDTAKALARMQRIAPLSKDPEPMGFLAELLVASGREAEAEPWRARARDGYKVLLGKHRLAFVDHASEFYAGIGGDPALALRLAEENLANRKTRRAYEIALDAATAAGATARACALVAEASTREFALAAQGCAG